MNDFRFPPISTLVGSTVGNFFRVLKGGTVSPRYYHKIFLTFLIILIITPLHWWEEFVFRKKLKQFRLEKAPLFIIGHWRSGTTLLHNVLCKDPSAGFMTTYYSLFPNNLASKWFFRLFIKLNIPGKRPSDNMELNINFPQEDEFAFSNCQPNAYYNFFYFPSHYKEIYEKSIQHQHLKESEITHWYKSYDMMLKKAMLDSGGSRLIIKNPVNTARIDKILKLYPDAKFLYIYRNPVTVFYSTQNFFRKLFPKVWLQEVDYGFIDNLIIVVYQKLLADYQVQKKLIPPGNLKELRFEHFEMNPVEELKKIYSRLLNEDFNFAEPYLVKYLNSLKGYTKNKYSVPGESLNNVVRELGYFMKLYNYDIPEEIVVNESST
jgi:omega-hydroxy-beta-dihydromenaquinone-9 sulfotransferase